jgi:hypothetical protein
MHLLGILETVTDSFEVNHVTLVDIYCEIYMYVLIKTQCTCTGTINNIFLVLYIIMILTPFQTEPEL